ncbi:MAG TPA: Clp protease N-terminal domain-containing protein [Gemmatimonadaceae bacterium]
MNGYNFTERVRKVLQLAREEAFALQHEYVGTEHILLGLCAEGGGVADAALVNLDVDNGSVREQVLKLVRPGKDDAAAAAAPASGGILGAIAGSMGLTRQQRDLPYTSRAKRVLELAMSEARELRHSYVGTEHLLLGLMREEKGIAAQVLTSKGLTVTGVRDEVVRLLGTEMPSTAASQSPPGPRLSREERQASITLVVEHPDGRVEAKKFGRANDAVRYLNALEY